MESKKRKKEKEKRIILVYKNSHQNNPTLLVAIKSNLHVSFCFLLLVFFSNDKNIVFK